MRLQTCHPPSGQPTVLIQCDSLDAPIPAAEGTGLKRRGFISFGSSISRAGFHFDLDVEQAGLGHTLACMSGSEVLQADPAYADTRLDFDIDLGRDHSLLAESWFTKSGVTANPGSPGQTHRWEHPGRSFTR